jgi:hypothetical protein
MISYDKELDIDKKLHNYLKITGHHHHHLSPWIRSFDLFRHRRVAIVSWGVRDPFFPGVCM